jgi:hypothetical protein
VQLTYKFISNIEYIIGNTIKVRVVEKTIPPITTDANGFCTSAPIPLASIIGKNPKDCH